RERLQIVLDRLFEAAPALEHYPEIAVCLDEIRLQRQRPPQTCCRLFQIPVLKERETEEVMGSGVRRAQMQGTAKARLRLPAVAAAKQGPSQRNVQLRRPAIDGDRA